MEERPLPEYCPILELMADCDAVATPAITHRTAQTTMLSSTESFLGLIERIEAAGVERTLTSESSVTLG